MKKTIAIIMAACILACCCLTGCGSSSKYIAKVNGQEVAVGWYLANAIYTAAQLEQTYGSANYESFLKAENGTDPTRTNAQVLDDAAKSAFEKNYAYKLYVESLGLSLDGIGQEAFDSEYDFYKSTFYDTSTYQRFLDMANVSEDLNKEIYKVSTYYEDMLYDYFFDEEIGVDKYTEDTIREFFDEYVDYAMMHILFTYQTTDSDGNALDDATIAANKAEAKAEAEDTLAQIKAGDLSFIDAMNTLSDDSSLSDYPDGYGWKEGDGTLPDIFTTAAKEMEYGELKLYESEYGFHIMLSIDPDTYFKTEYLIYETAYTQTYIDDKVNEFKMNNMQVEYNESALNKYKFANIGATGIQLLSLTAEG